MSAPLFAATVRQGQHLLCLVAPELSLHEALSKCLERGIKVLDYAQEGDRYLFKCMATTDGVEVSNG